MIGRGGSVVRGTCPNPYARVEPAYETRRGRLFGLAERFQAGFGLVAIIGAYLGSFQGPEIGELIILIAASHPSVAKFMIVGSAWSLTMTPVSIATTLLMTYVSITQRVLVHVHEPF